MEIKWVFCTISNMNNLWKNHINEKSDVKVCFEK